VNQKKAVNKMRTILIEKVVINIGVGEAGEKLQKAEKVIEILTKQKPIRTESKSTNRDFGIRKKMPIGCKVTLRKDKAEKFLKDALWIKENRLADYSFDKEGNFSFGIPDYTDFPNQKYDPDIGIFGMDVCVRLTRYGRRVANRTRASTKVPVRHRITPTLAKEFLKTKFNVEVVKE
jgi:large subunit ribosomal protein L5